MSVILSAKIVLCTLDSGQLALDPIGAPPLNVLRTSIPIPSQLTPPPADLCLLATPLKMGVFNCMNMQICKCYAQLTIYTCRGFVCRVESFHGTSGGRCSSRGRDSSVPL